MSRFRTKKSLLNQNVPYMMLKMRFPFLYASTSLDTKTLKSPRIVILKAVYQFVVLLLSTFSGFSIFVMGFSFVFGKFSYYCVVLLDTPLSDRDIEMCLLSLES